MADDRIRKLTMPKWGFSMTQGLVVEWLAAEGTEISSGDEILEVETEKAIGVVELLWLLWGVAELSAPFVAHP